MVSHVINGLDDGAVKDKWCPMPQPSRAQITSDLFIQLLVSIADARRPLGFLLLCFCREPLLGQLLG